LSCPLSELPVNEYTASELVRLCLRHQDIEDNPDSDLDEDNDKENAAFEEEVVGLDIFFVHCMTIVSIGDQKL